MIIAQTNHSCADKAESLARLFFEPDEDAQIYSYLTDENKRINVYTSLIFGGRSYDCDYYLDYPEKYLSVKNLYDTAVTRSLIGAAQKVRPVSVPWGCLTGIRPAKLVREMLGAGFSEDEAVSAMTRLYGVIPEKAELAAEVAKNEMSIISRLNPDSVSVYIGIPFCPTRCKYCSFVSADMRISGKYMDEFVRLLTVEIEKTGEIIKNAGKRVQSVYIGGGTPTALSEGLLSDVLDAVCRHIDMSGAEEFTLEAGRPDTITEEKLISARAHGVTRISVNPQTMNDKTLARVGRAHTADRTRDAFNTARRIGFDSINTDLIAGLPGESCEDFCKSLDEVCALDPEDITVHTMCVKRAADLRYSEKTLTEGREAAKMLEYTRRRMRETGRNPYYMYRQKNIIGNLENCAFAKNGRMSVYNVNIMEEVQTIIAAGGGGSTKLVYPDGTIERIFNFKDPAEYIRRFDDIIKRKEKTGELLLM